MGKYLKKSCTYQLTEKNWQNLFQKYAVETQKHNVGGERVKPIMGSGNSPANKHNHQYLLNLVRSVPDVMGVEQWPGWKNNFFGV
jgi:hypothetical protein